jgi:phosphoribosylamine--glycine ligase
MPGVTVFHAGSAADPSTDDVVTDGGRVLGVTALGGTLEEARTRAYDAVGAITWPGMHHRTDIARRAAAETAAARPPVRAEAAR